MRRAWGCSGGGGPGLVNGADRLEEPSAVPECHGSEAEFRNQETCIAQRCKFHGVSLSSLEPLYRLTSATGDGDIAFEANPGDYLRGRRLGLTPVFEGFCSVSLPCP